MRDAESKKFVHSVNENPFDGFFSECGYSYREAMRDYLKDKAEWEQRMREKYGEGRFSDLVRVISFDDIGPTPPCKVGYDDECVNLYLYGMNEPYWIRWEDLSTIENVMWWACHLAGKANVNGRTVCEFLRCCCDHLEIDVEKYHR